MKRALSSALLILLLPLTAACAENLQFSANRMTSVLAKGREHTILSGEAKITNGSTVITADQIELYGPSFRYAQATGQVKVVDPKQGMTLVSQNLFYDRTEDLIRVEGYAEMQDTKNELVVKGGFLENRGKEDVTIVEIGVRILKIADKQQMACRAEFARYNRKSDILVLSGTPVVYWKGDEYRAAQITINLKTDDINLEGAVSGKIVSGTSGQSGSKQETPSTGGAAPSGGGPQAGSGAPPAGSGATPATGQPPAGSGATPAAGQPPAGSGATPSAGGSP